MEFKGIFTLITVALLTYCVQITVAFPRDSSIVKTEEIVEVTERAEEKLRTESILDYTSESPEPVSLHYIHEIVNCEFEEVTEDIVCREHCLPKGYSYGLCVGRKCSCV